MTTPKKKQKTEENERNILNYVKSVGTVTITQVADALAMKYDTVKDCLYRLAEDGKIYHINGTRSPRVYSIWCKVEQDCSPVIKQPIYSPNSTDLYGRVSVGCPLRRAAHPQEILRERGFVCHPKVNEKILGLDFVRGHYKGCYTVNILKKGSVEDTYALPEYNVTGGWCVDPMKQSGNLMVRGHIKMNDEEWKFHALTRKTGEIGKLNIYVHSRWIYTDGSQETANAEFIQQVLDICRILAVKGWQFGNTIQPNGQFHAGINSVELGQSMPKGYPESSTDALHFDQSHGTPEGEIYGGLDYDDYVSIMKHLPNHVKALYGMIGGLTQATTNLATAISSLATNGVQPTVKPDQSTNQTYGGMYQ